MIGQSGIKVEGHIGTWYVIGEKEIHGQWYRLLEHETFGQDAACIILDNRSRCIMEDVHNGFDDLVEFMESFESWELDEPEEDEDFFRDEDDRWDDVHNDFVPGTNIRLADATPDMFTNRLKR